MSNYYAIETEEHSPNTITHYAQWGEQVEAQYMHHYAVCGRVVAGTVWEAGSVDGLRCKHCMTKLAKRGSR